MMCLSSTSSMEMFAHIVPSAPLEIAVVIGFDVRVNGARNPLAVSSADSFQCLISSTLDERGCGRGW